MTVTAEQKEIFRQLLDCDNIWIIPHKSPDGDALASAEALKHIFTRLGKKSAIVCSDPVSRRLRFITGGKENLEADFTPDYTVCVDVAAPDLIGGKVSGMINGKVNYCIDHHISNTAYAEKTIVMPHASSAGEVLYSLIRDAGISLDEFLARMLYTAISFDTGCFKYSNAGAETHLAAAELLGFGFDAAAINADLFDYAPIEQLRLEANAVNKIRMLADGKIAILTVTKEMIAESGLDERDAEGLSSLTRRVAGTAASATLKQTDEGMKVSLRSNENFDVSAVAARFGGGGHLRAAGCIIKATPEQAEKMVAEAIVEDWNRYNDNSGR